MGKKRSGVKIERVQGTTYFTLFSATTTGTTALRADNTNFTRLAILADVFGLFRFTELEIHFLAQNGVTGDTAVGVFMGQSDSPPATVAQVAQCEYSGVNWADQTTPTIIRVPRSYLVGQSANKWYKTAQSASVESFSEDQGFIVGACSVSSALNLMVRWTAELCSFLPSASVPKLLPKPICESRPGDSPGKQEADLESPSPALLALARRLAVIGQPVI